MPASRQTVMVTSASMGIGAAVAARLERSGWRMFQTSRRPDLVRDGSDALETDWPI